MVHPMTDISFKSFSVVGDDSDFCDGDGVSTGDGFQWKYDDLTPELAR